MYIWVYAYKYTYIHIDTYIHIHIGMAQNTGMDRSAVIRTYGTRSCQQAFWSGPCHKGLHGYEYNIVLFRYKYRYRNKYMHILYNRHTYAHIYIMISSEAWLQHREDVGYIWYVEYTWISTNGGDGGWMGPTWHDSGMERVWIGVWNEMDLNF